MKQNIYLECQEMQKAYRVRFSYASLLLFVHSVSFGWIMLAKPIAWTQHEQQNKTLYRSRDCKMNKLTLASKLHAFLRVVEKARWNRKYYSCSCYCCQDASFFHYFSKIECVKCILFLTKIQPNSYSSKYSKYILLNFNPISYYLNNYYNFRFLFFNIMYISKNNYINELNTRASKFINRFIKKIRQTK